MQDALDEEEDESDEELEHATPLNLEDDDGRRTC